MKSAFILGKQMAKDVTKLFPYPIELKFEKVYESCVLVSKKRYAGMKVETFGENPIFDCKGLEAVRRDGCELTRSVMNQCLLILF